MASLTKDVWLGADNEFRLTMQERSAAGTVNAVDLTSVSSMILIVGGFTHTQLSTDAAKEVDWLSPSGTGEVVFKLGELLKTNGVATGQYVVELHILDPASPNGVVWFSKANKELALRVISDNTP